MKNGSLKKKSIHLKLKVMEDEIIEKVIVFDHRNCDLSKDLPYIEPIKFFNPTIKNQLILFLKEMFRFFCSGFNTDSLKGDEND